MKDDDVVCFYVATNDVITYVHGKKGQEKNRLDQDLDLEL